ncbi:hypothetical protein D3C86_2064380 [compost metagenome]
MRGEHHVVAGAETDLIEHSLSRGVGGILHADSALLLESRDHAGRQPTFPTVDPQHFLGLRQTGPQAQPQRQ